MFFVVKCYISLTVGLSYVDHVVEKHREQVKVKVLEDLTQTLSDVNQDPIWQWQVLSEVQLIAICYGNFIFYLLKLLLKMRTDRGKVHCVDVRNANHGHEVKDHIGHCAVGSQEDHADKLKVNLNEDFDEADENRDVSPVKLVRMSTHVPDPVEGIENLGLLNNVQDDHSDPLRNVHFVINIPMLTVSVSERNEVLFFGEILKKLVCEHEKETLLADTDKQNSEKVL